MVHPGLEPGARRSRGIALQAAAVGMGLSLIAMLAAAAGLLAPVAGALVQEVIDVLAIAIALRAVLPAEAHTVTLAPADAAIARRLRDEHSAVRPIVEQVRVAADGLATDGCDLAPVRALLVRLENETLPHERAEQLLLYPVVAKALGGADPTGAMTRTHAEIEHQVGRLARLLADLGDDPAEPEDVIELRGLLYGLYSVLRLHNAQEEEGAFSLIGA